MPSYAVALSLITGTLALSLSPRSLPSAPDPVVLEALSRARRKSDVRDIHQVHDIEAIQQAWHSLPPVQRASLLLCRAFDAEIIHDNTDRELDAL